MYSKYNYVIISIFFGISGGFFCWVGGYVRLFFLVTITAIKLLVG
eukprot:UN05664